MLLAKKHIVTFYFLTRFNKIAIQGKHQMAVDKEAISLLREKILESIFS